MKSPIIDALADACRRAGRKHQLLVAEDATNPESKLTWLSSEGHQLALIEGEGPRLFFPLSYFEAVMHRYAQPLAELGEVRGSLEAGEGTIARMLYVPRFDVEPKDYLVWLPRKGEPLVVLCSIVVPPLLHLAKRRVACGPP